MRNTEENNNTINKRIEIEIFERAIEDRGFASFEFSAFPIAVKLSTNICSERGKGLFLFEPEPTKHNHAPVNIPPQPRRILIVTLICEITSMKSYNLKRVFFFFRQLSHISHST